MDQLIAFDRSLFEKINLDWTNGFFDMLFPSITDLHKSPYFLIVVVALLGFWIFKKRMQALRWILILVLALGLSDAIAYRVIKAAVNRPRPADAGMQVQFRTQYHSGSSFPSNHTANMFAAATVMTGAFPAAAPVWFLIAAAVGYSRVYVGVHFPLDVLAGALLGIAIGLILRRLFRKWLAPIRSDEDSYRERSSNPSS